MSVEAKLLQSFVDEITKMRDLDFSDTRYHD